MSPLSIDVPGRREATQNVSCLRKHASNHVTLKSEARGWSSTLHYTVCSEVSGGYLVRPLSGQRDYSRHWLLTKKIVFLAIKAAWTPDLHGIAWISNPFLITSWFGPKLKPTTLCKKLCDCRLLPVGIDGENPQIIRAEPVFLSLQGWAPVENHRFYENWWSVFWFRSFLFNVFLYKTDLIHYDEGLTLGKSASSLCVVEIWSSSTRLFTNFPVSCVKLTLRTFCGPVYNVSCLYHVLWSMLVVLKFSILHVVVLEELWTFVRGTKQSVKITSVQFHWFGSRIYLVRFNVCKKTWIMWNWNA